MTIKTHERFGQVRTVEQDGSTWYVGRDVSKALGYKNAEGFVAKHVKDADKKCVHVRSLSINSAPRTIIINRNGLTDLCHAATSVDADNILHWLLDDVKVEEKAEEKTAALVPQVFQHEQFGKLRRVIINGDSWFIGKDVAESLEYKNTNEAIRDHVDSEDKRIENISYGGAGEKNSTHVGGIKATVLINKSGIYSLILDSQMPKAKEYRHWVTSEVLPTIDETGSYKGQGSLFPDEEQPVKKIRRPLPEYAIVYIILFSNGLVKIGYTSDFNRRLKELRKETKLDVVEIFTTGMMPLDDARKLEATLKAKFFDYLVSGEFFNVDFQTVKAALQTSPAERLIALADKLQDSDVKQTLLAKAAALLIG